VRERERAVSFVRSILMLFMSSSQRSIAYEQNQKELESRLDNFDSTRSVPLKGFDRREALFDSQRG